MRITREAPLPGFLADLLASCPAAGDGVNPWLFRVSRHLHVHMDAEAMFALLRQKTEGCGRFVSDNEIRRQIKCSRASAFQPKDPEIFARIWGVPTPRVIGVDSSAGNIRPNPWPKPNIDAIREIVAGGWGLYDLWEASPFRLDDDQRHTEEIIDILFPGNPLLCCGWTAYQFATRRRETWRGLLAGLPFIVPNPMLKREVLTLEGKPSEHCIDATAARIYLIGEFDFAEFGRDGKTLSVWAPLVHEWREAGITVADACAALHRHLAERLPLVAAISSGGKSLHGYYQAFNQSEAHLREFMEYAVSLGADHVLWTRSQFTRMPDGTRENGKIQTCYYLDPGKAVTDEK